MSAGGISLVQNLVIDSGSTSVSADTLPRRAHLEAGELTTWSATAEFIVGSSCAALVGRDDLELFVSFDPWHELEGESDFEAPQDPSHQVELIDIMAASAVSAEGCESCETAYKLHDVVGLDAELRELELSSIVAVVPVVAEGGADPVATTTRPDFNLTMASRVVGLDKTDSLEPGLVRRVHTIRPLGSDAAGLPLIEVVDGNRIERHDLRVAGSAVVMTSAELYIEDDTREAIVDGAWSNIDEFELVTCIETEFEQAVFSGEVLPRANDCGAIPVVIARDQVGLDSSPLPSSNSGAAKARSAEVYENGWAFDAGYGFDWTDLYFKTHFETNSSDGPSNTYSGAFVSQASGGGHRADHHRCVSAADRALA
jgi:hypothetical protein